MPSGSLTDPWREWLLSVPDEIVAAEERGQPIVYRPSGPPPEHVVRLMATLGVRIEVTSVKAISAHEAAATRDCTQPLCVNETLPGTDRCRPHTRAAELRANGTIERPPAFNGRLAWTKASIVAAMQRWAEEHDGQPPSSSAKGPNSWVKAGEWWPNVHTVVYHFGSWREGIVAAGLVPLGDSTAPKGSVRVPQAPETPRASLADAPAVTPPSAVGVESPEPTTATVEPGTRTDEPTPEQIAQIQADGAQVDAYIASIEGAKEEVVDGEIILTDSFAELARELEDAYAAVTAAEQRLNRAAEAFKAHPLIDNIEGDWGIPCTTAADELDALPLSQDRP